MNTFLKSLRRVVAGIVRGSNPPVRSLLNEFVDESLLLGKSEMVRLGSRYGGWWIPKDAGVTEASVCYLAGAGEDISFDCAMAMRFGCQIRIVDPTPRAIAHFAGLRAATAAGDRFFINDSKTDRYQISPQMLERIKYLPFGLADGDVEMKFYLPQNEDHVSCSTVNLQKTDRWFDAQCYRLSTLMSMQGDTIIDMLKMDIEGGEYAVIKDLVSSKKFPRLLLIEFDEVQTPLDDDASDRIRAHVQMLLDANMRCVFIEGSNATFVQVG